MDFYKQLKSYDKMVTKILKEHSMGLFSESAVPILHKQEFRLDSLHEEDWEKISSSEKYNYYYSAYLELIKYIYADFYYQEYLSLALNDEVDVPINIQRTDQIKDIELYKDDFYAAFELLISN